MVDFLSDHVKIECPVGIVIEKVADFIKHSKGVDIPAVVVLGTGKAVAVADQVGNIPADSAGNQDTAVDTLPVVPVASFDCV